MKKFLVSVIALFSMNTSIAFADDLSAEALLLQMNRASQKLNYELSYILIKRMALSHCFIVMPLKNQNPLLI